MYTDADIMHKIKSGNVEKLGLLFERYKMPLFAFFYRNTCCRQTSEDLVQNVFLRILKYRNSYAEKGSFKTWMYQIAHHVHVDHYRKNKKYQQLADEAYNLPDDCSQEQDVILNEQIDILQQALEKLEPEKRELLIMAKFQQLKYKEIAGIYKVSEGNIKIRVFRALNDLQQIYAKLEKRHD